MAGAMNKLVAITRSSDEATRHVIDLAPLNAFASRQPLTCEGDGRVAGVAHHGEDCLLAGRNLIAGASEGHR